LEQFYATQDLFSVAYQLGPARWLTTYGYRVKSKLKF